MLEKSQRQEAELSILPRLPAILFKNLCDQAKESVTLDLTSGGSFRCVFSSIYAMH